MHDAAALEAINHEQLVTATDRLLLRGDTLPRRASVPSIAGRRADPRIAIPTRPLGAPVRARGTSATPFVRGTHPRLIQRAIAPAGSAPRSGRTFAPPQLALGSSPALVLPHASLAHSRLARRSSADLYARSAPLANVHVAPQRLARATQAYASPAPRTRAGAEQTLFVRAVRPRPFPVTIVIPMLLGIIAGLAAML